MFTGSVGETSGWYWHVRSVFWVLGLCFVSELNGDKCDTRLAASDEVKLHPERRRATERRWSRPGSLASGRFYPCWHGSPRRNKVAPALVTKIHSWMINWQKCCCVPNLDSCINTMCYPPLLWGRCYCEIRIKISFNGEYDDEQTMTSTLFDS